MGKRERWELVTTDIEQSPFPAGDRSGLGRSFWVCDNSKLMIWLGGGRGGGGSPRAVLAGNMEPCCLTIPLRRGPRQWQEQSGYPAHPPCPLPWHKSPLFQSHPSPKLRWGRGQIPRAEAQKAFSFALGSVQGHQWPSLWWSSSQVPPDEIVSLGADRMLLHFSWLT